MACFNPINAWRYPAPNSALNFKPQPTPPYEYLRVPCGKCSGCRADQSLMWSIRAYHEFTQHESSSFVTLTYSDDNLPSDGLISKRHLQLFFKRLRKARGKLRYIACGEYGEQTRRPHYHAIIFGDDYLDFPNSVPISDSLYTHTELSKIWGLGQVTIAPCSMSTIMYVCGYVNKKINDTDTFSLMSRRPYIGADFLSKFADDLRRTGSVSIEGKEYPIPPRYLVSLPEYFEEVIADRKVLAQFRAHLGTDAALDNKRLNKRSVQSQKKETL